MNIPGYDAYILRGPDERPNPVIEECDKCAGSGWCRDDEGAFPCPECEGTGEIEASQEEPDDDYEYERRRDLMGEGKP